MTTTVQALDPRDRAVEVKAIIRESPPRIALQWNDPDPATLIQQKVYKRLKEGGNWVEIASVPREVTTLADDAVVPGVNYEYLVYRIYDGHPDTASGWLSAGIRAPLIGERGTVILLVDDTMALPLKAELKQFMLDLQGDGWTVVRQDVARTASPPTVRATVQSLQRSSPDAQALILFGHLAVPYSGDYSGDGHPEHFGAWPADAYYGDLNGTWTDTAVNDSLAADSRNFNVPGDGKFDQSVLPSDVELQVGRIDLASMPAFSLNETELLRQYLGRNHAYRFQTANFVNLPRRALVDDNFGFPPGESFATSGWRNFAVLFGSPNVQALDWFTTLSTQKYLAAYGCGPGSYMSARGVGKTMDFATQPSQAVFNLIFGSFHGDWDTTDNFLRAPLGGLPESLGLVSAWAGRPHWFIHPMGLGETIGYCTRLSQNNLTTFPGTAGGYEANDCERAVHIALMGDPTLRLHTVKPPANIGTQSSGNGLIITWTAPSDSPIEGYIISRGTSPQGPFVRVSGALVPGTTFVDRSVTTGLFYTYMVRAVKLETTTSGSYLNPSQGAFSYSAQVPGMFGAEINVVGNGAMIADDDTVPLKVNGTDFGTTEVGATVTRTFTVRSTGTVPLVIAGVNVTGANPGDFIVSNAPTDVPNGTTRDFQVAFRPMAEGARTARISILSNTNDANETSYDFALGGNGLAPQPAINLATTWVDGVLRSGATASGVISISNPGNGPLDYTVSHSLDTYSFRDSDALGARQMNWIDISTTGTLVQNWLDVNDGATPEIPLGFNFPYYGTTMSTLRISPNGFLGPLKIQPYGQNGPLPNTSASMPMIAPFWTDAILDSGSRIFYQNYEGTFIVQYDNVSMLGAADRRFTCEVFLKPTGEIVFQYKALSAIGHGYTIGIQNRMGDDALQVAYSTPYVHPNLRVEIRPPGLQSWMTLPAATGTVPAHGTQQIPLSFNAAGLASGIYDAVVTIRSNAPDGKPRTVPVRLWVSP